MSVIGHLNHKRTWDHNIDSPILAKRDLDYGILKRFLNRQKKTFKRIKRKLFGEIKKIN